MIEKLLQDKIKEYNPTNMIEQENVIQELIQQYILGHLSKTDYFSKVQFHGGTFLRLIHGLDRFSEDLDFMLNKPEPDFDFTPFLNIVQENCRLEGLSFEIKDRSILGRTVGKAFLKTDSIGKEIKVDFPFARTRPRKIRIKLEVDINPPKGSIPETHYLRFPFLFPLTTQSLESSFGSKSHALLCRNYVKGRDWYDFIWYISKGIIPDLPLLERALEIAGPWKNRKTKVTPEWYFKELRKKIETIDWHSTTEDVRRFIPNTQIEQLDLWQKKLFLYQADRLEQLVRSS